jgi:uncharacterized protein (TIGR02391 family)
VATRRRAPEPPPIEPRELTPEQIRHAIDRLRQRIGEVRALATDRVRHDDPRRDVVTDAVRNTILETFGPNSREWRQHQNHRIREGPMLLNVSDGHLQATFQAGVPHTAAMLEGLIDRLAERLADLGVDPAARARETFDGLDLHPRIAIACAAVYRDGHYANAVSNASVALVNFVKEKSGRFDLDGAPLMLTVFSANKPRLAFNALVDQTDQDEQQGMMHLFAGAVLALRNPRAHKLLQDSPEQALDYIAFLSMLARAVDRAEVRP